ncbi:hypothetical protein TNCV_3065801 [Trichonephila clavipes]|uniref:Uncharacterized protein n=1 Tax=Trichonephila clavipes TaxID=2585209 RepID=A0A8X6V3A9_TRICX|nr:hypothetical protein TNCV_3065801 [Trichonephila clavipes]
MQNREVGKIFQSSNPFFKKLLHGGNCEHFGLKRSHFGTNMSHVRREIPFIRYNFTYTVGDRLTNTFKDFCVRITNTFKKDFLCLDNEHIFGGDQGDTPEIMDEILTTARNLQLEVNEDDIEELIMEQEDELTIEELQEIFNEKHQETQRNVSPSEQEEDER